MGQPRAVEKEAPIGMETSESKMEPVILRSEEATTGDHFRTEARSVDCKFSGETDLKTSINTVTELTLLQRSEQVWRSWNKMRRCQLRKATRSRSAPGFASPQLLALPTVASFISSVGQIFDLSRRLVISVLYESTWG